MSRLARSTIHRPIPSMGRLRGVEHKLMNGSLSQDFNHTPPQNREEIREKSQLQAVVAEAFRLLKEGAPERAIAYIAPFSPLAARSEIGCYVFGLICFNADDPRDALSWFDRALNLKPAYPEALGAKAIILQRLGRPQEALEVFEAAWMLRPTDVEILFSIGVVRQSLGQMKEALDAYEQALCLRPDYCEALTNRGALLERFGRFAEALECFEEIARQRNDDSVNLFNMGSVLQKLGRLEDALAAYEKAARIGPPDPETELNRGNVLQKLSRFEEAIACYDQALLYRAHYPQAFYNKGIALQGLGKPHEALAAYDAALGLEPSYCEAWCNRGNILHELKRLPDALLSYREALKVRPHFLPALTNRANVLLELNRFEEALHSCTEALKHDPNHARALGISGAILHKLSRFHEALEALDKAAALNPASPEVALNRGNVLQELGRLPEAIAAYEKALALKNPYPEALSGLGVALKEQGRFNEALACFDQALDLKPDFADARNNRAGLLLLYGRFEQGFADYESRWDRSNAPRKIFESKLPYWEGAPLQGQKLIVFDEQGLGDLIQFARYLPCLVDAGAEVTFLARRSMHRLLSSLQGPIRLIASVDPEEDFTYQIPLMGLPRAFGTRLETIPAAVPYLKAEVDRITQWAERIGGPSFRIGICWKGNPHINLRRGMSPDHFAPLAALPNVRLFSLMRESSLTEAEGSRIPDFIETLGPDFDAGDDAFLDCAAVMDNLDLIITSDTSIAHLAGALARPVFLALKQIPDWRWLMEREDCPWYPTMRLFRQKQNGEWREVFDAMTRAVAEKLRQEPTPATGHDSLGPSSSSLRHPLAIPSGIGELIDKITILEIKASRIGDTDKRAHVEHELALLRQLRMENGFDTVSLAPLETKLKAANLILWEAEDALRQHEAEGNFGANFIHLARQVYKTNDQRAALKREINIIFNSPIIEEKSYNDRRA
ncbi:DUF6165 family protein [Beijerinckia indica]|uniref:TPR repeat-containing protein n=1 Tax=Beijerinckia indica subsp. indica (strain ATCC 9039 / DSM 1715 / NCIMB 8712) TaxID=395963 RepID=B2ICZ6_BEII9|nr:DUF6165 family protein [Beijerinckia indica]ACB96761.1 TPR repeat-containing protein [Beijerinckia indica subsp. indica ATCC 9039]